MAQQRRGLGKGLGALIPESPVRGDAARDGVRGDEDPGRGGDWGGDNSGPRSQLGAAPSAGAGGMPASVGQSDDVVQVPGAHYAEIPVTSIVPNPRQPRRTFDEEALEELADSIREVGLLQPVVVRAAGPGSYELIMGERRWRASQRAGLTDIAVIVRDTPDTDLLRDALIENLHRQQLDPLEEAAAYQQLLDDFGATHEQLAQKIGRSRPHISNTLRLLNLPPAVQKRVAAGVLSAGHARALLSLNDAGAQDRLAHRIVAEGLSVRAVEEIVSVGADADKAKPRASRGGKAPVAPGLNHLANRLSDIFETRVKVELGRHKGKIVVEFGSLDDLERIVNAMAPQDGKNAVAAADGAGDTADGAGDTADGAGES